MAVQKITAKQVGLLLSLFYQAGIPSTMQQLEWLEYHCDIEVGKLEDLNTGQIDIVIKKLRKEFNLK